MKKNGLLGALFMVLVVATLTAGLGGCASSAPSRFFELSPVSAVESRIVGEGRSITVGITRIRMPDYLDRPQIATRVGPNEIRYDEFNRWAEPLKENFSRVLADNLAVFLGTEGVLVAGWSGAVPLNYQVWVEVMRFDANPNGDVTLIARWALYQQDEKKLLVTKNFTIIEAAGAPGYEAMASAGSRAVADLTREIAEAITAVY